MALKRSYIWAGVMTLAIAGWLGSGHLMSSPETPEQTQDAARETASPLFKVEVERISARPRPATLVVRSRTEAFRKVDVRARTAGIVEDVPIEEGRRAKQGEVLCRLDMGTRNAQLAEARARLASAKLELDAADSLVKQNFASRTKYAAAKAAFDAAQSAVELVERDIGYTTINAPIDGFLDTRPAEPGSFLQVGGLCARLLVLDPLLVIGSVSEREVAQLKPGLEGTAKLVTGETVNGKIRHVATSADPATRTFRVELEVPNPELALREGVTADVAVPLATENAHRFSPALLTLDDAGRIGVRIVDDTDTVRFMPVTVLADEADGVWVAGLPENVRLITVGQDYVVDGQKVRTAETDRIADAGKEPSQ